MTTEQRPPTAVAAAAEPFLAERETPVSPPPPGTSMSPAPTPPPAAPGEPPAALRPAPGASLGPAPVGTPAPPADPDELRREIAATRSDLADTLAALVAKGDMKARVSDELTHLRARATDTVRRSRTLIIAVSGALAAAVAGVVIWQLTRGKGRR
ncbi:DUF3618 domain-containing protein [Luedemannella helvata]|uniref:DUF3618 domain-containing protein n=1 Tax=Luedemannella helvata TaxID=349315 RepID=A0ABN2KST9_9ACTN